jgi:hypothetical protein
MDNILRFPSAVKYDPAIDVWLRAQREDLLKDPAHLLEGTGKRGRHVKLRPGREIDSAALAELVEVAYVDIRARLRK